jgi:hypothetical protein
MILHIIIYVLRYESAICKLNYKKKKRKKETLFSNEQIQ